MHCNNTYRLVKIENNKEKIVLETESSCIERALDYFYLMIPESYGNKKYSIRIKPTTFKNVAKAWD